MEFFRYLIVGGSSFIVDSGTLYVFKMFILPNWNGLGVLIATAIGFITGLVFNYILSLYFVFTSEAQQKKGRTVKDFIIFAVIGIIGLILTELGMHLGANVLKFNFMLVKIVVAAIVLFWNYIARKVIIFK